ncbi:mitochondrial carrier protein [Lasiosphaeris hirsuta]|uniref:Mitochondrial carrier protein n=1 Tax=Lasiosphaeris hirsuta TaxID=260670 RepID=A0AA40BBC9_9PEZI|nr:mitochondrial carrier protein [Lasiosphaeris hirsuta]
MASHVTRAAQTSEGQNHDRLARDASLALPSGSLPASDNIGAPTDPVEITIAQKMMSATSGSLLTGLLATPLDVVRVRWQSQGVSQPHPVDFQKLAVSTPNAFRPMNLGVTACCREVFFMNNNSEICLAGPRISAGAGTLRGNTLAHSSGCAVEQTQQRTFNSTFDGLRKIARNEGFTTLWRGLSPTLLMAVPANIIYFTGYESLRFNPNSPIARTVHEAYAPLAAGMAARVLAATAVSPIELFRTRLQASQGSSRPLRDTFTGITDMVSIHGYRSLWRGLTLTLWRDVPFSGMYWWGYETIRGKLTDARERSRGRTLDLEAETTDSGRARTRARRRSQSRENHTETFTDSFVAGALSGAFASVATMPFDVGKTRTQVFRETTVSGITSAVPEERSMARLLWHIFKTEGAAGLFKGWIPRTLKVAPACAIMISSYEVGKRAFRGVNERALARDHERTAQA